MRPLHNSMIRAWLGIGALQWRLWKGVIAVGGRARVRLIMFLLPLALIYSASISRAAEITYQDGLGRVVKIPVPVKRAVILVGPDDLIPALNIWDKVVGVSTYTYAHDNLLKAAKSDWKDSVVPVASGMADVNIEALIKLRPDVVVTWSYSHETIRFMEQNGLRVIAINPETLREFYGVIDLFGRLFGRGKEAARTINEMEGDIQTHSGKGVRNTFRQDKKGSLGSLWRKTDERCM